MAHTRDFGIASATWVSGVLLLFLLLIAPANASANVSMGPIKGDVYLNQRLNVYVSLRGEGEFRASQLHPSCLKGEIIDRSQAASFDTIVQDAIIQFESTVRNGGLLRIESSDKILSPLSILQIKSVCPLAQFDQSWSLLASPLDAARPESPEPETKKTNFVQSPREFKLRGSALLSESRKVPDAWVIAKQQVAVYEEKKAKEQLNSQRLQDEAELALYQPPLESLVSDEELQALQGVSDEQPDSEVVQQIEDERVELAQAQIASMNQEGYSADEDLQRAANPEPMTDSAFTLNTTTALAILLVVMLILSASYYLVRKHGLAKIKGLLLKKGATNGTDQPMGIEPELMNRTIDLNDLGAGEEQEEDEPVTKPGRMFQSLLDDDSEQVYQELNEVRKPEEASILTDSSMEIIEQLKVDRRYPWDLPDVYRAIIDQTSIELTNEEWQDMRLSKSQIAIVELAFKKATMEESVLESEYDLILDYMQIRNEDDQKAISEDSISELIKSFVKAKIFEQENQALVARFIDNLSSLSRITTTRTLCFSSEHWYEFVESLRPN